MGKWTVWISGQTETVSVRFRPKISAFFGFGVSVFSLFGASAEILFSAETAFFGRNTLFWLILAAHLCKKSFTKTAFFGQNKVFRQKQAILAKNVYRPKFRLFPGGLVLVSVFRPKICFVCPLVWMIRTGPVPAWISQQIVMPSYLFLISILFLILQYCRFRGGISGVLNMRCQIYITTPDQKRDFVAGGVGSLLFTRTRSDWHKHETVCGSIHRTRKFVQDHAWLSDFASMTQNCDNDIQ